jgi:hypothetical protein
VGIAVPSATATQSGKTVPVQQLSSVVLKLIRTVEGSDLACETRNSIVGKLRLLDDALLSGRRTAAQALAQAWRQDTWSLMAAGVISPEVGSSLHNRLSHMQGAIGIGWPAKPGPTRHWKPLPSCESTTDVAASSSVLAAASTNLVGSYTPTGADPMSTLHILLKALLSQVPVVGFLLAAMVDLFWPAGSTDTSVFQEIVDATVFQQVAAQVSGIGHALADDGGWVDEVGGWRLYCESDEIQAVGGYDSYECVSGARELWNSWNALNQNTFLQDREAFKMAGYEVKLLPLFAQFENLYLAFLRDGIALHEYWRARTDLDRAWGPMDSNSEGHPIPVVAMAKELNPANTDRGVGWVNTTYNDGLAAQPDATTKVKWNTRNAYVRTETLQVLDFRDMWKYMDPNAYPEPIPGGVKQTRMIYSDIVMDPGNLSPIQYTSPGNLPRNVAGPLKELTFWTEVTKPLLGKTAIGSVQATSPPLMGPAQSGAITGDTAQPVNRARYFDLRARGPIVAVDAQSQLAPAYGISSIGLTWARIAGTGLTDWTGTHNSNLSTKHFAYDGEVLATVQVPGTYAWGNEAGNIADAFVFGFRYADSYLPTGELIGLGAGKCLTLQTAINGPHVVIHTCEQPPTSGQIWTYEPALQQISVMVPSEWSDTDPTQSGKRCLATAGGGTAAGTAVVVSPCDDGAFSYDLDGKNQVMSSQRWTLEAVGAGVGKVTNVKSGLVLEVPLNSSTDGTELQLAPYAVAKFGQLWRASDPLTGEIHGIGSGRCVDVPDYSTTPGTQVQIYDCHGNAAQQWTYNPANKELVYAHAPSMCLEARAGGTSSGTAVQINICTGAAEQRWTLRGNGGYVTNDKSGLELSVPGGHTGNGNLLQLITANGTHAQLWSRTSTLGGAVYGIGSARCLTAPRWVNGTATLIQTCATPLGAAQTWTYHPIAQTYTIDSPSGPMCLDAAGGSKTPGAAVVITGCTGAASQKWARNLGNVSHVFGASTISNVDSELILSVSGGGTVDGTPVVLSTQGTPLPSSQQWVWSLS